MRQDQATVTAALDAPAPEGGIGGFLFAGEDGTASEDIDFTMPLGIFIPGGQRSATAAISITGDDPDEEDETVVMLALFDIGTALLEDKITLTIADDDTAGVTVNAASPLWRWPRAGRRPTPWSWTPGPRRTLRSRPPATTLARPRCPRRPTPSRPRPSGHSLDLHGQRGCRH